MHWKVLPEGLLKDSILYKVSIVTEHNDELISKSVSHVGKNNNYEKCIFTTDEETSYHSQIEGYELNLYPGEEKSQIVGRYLSEISENRRTGIYKENNWIWETYQKTAVTLPRLKWIKKDDSTPTNYAHLTVSFDTFDSKIETLSATDQELLCEYPIEVYGLFPEIIRMYKNESNPVWISTIAPKTKGEKHPYNPKLTDDL